MGVELARVRLRGWYAVVAAVVLVVGLPLFQGAALAPSGYVSAVQAIVAHQDFGPLLTWVAAHPVEARVYRILQMVPFLLAFALPASLRLVLWPERTRGSAVLTVLGATGFALFAMALLIGLFTSSAAAGSYATSTAAQRLSVVEGYASSYALETLISRVLGGLCLAVYLTRVSLRVVRQRGIPMWIGYFGGIVAALLGATAVLFALSLRQVQTPTSTLAFVALGLWLAATGFALTRIRALPGRSSYQS